jgi:hypothetical protein
VIVLLFFFAKAQIGSEHLFNIVEEVRGQAQQATDIVTLIQESGKIKQLPELLYRIEKIDSKITQLQEIHKNQH